MKIKPNQAWHFIRRDENGIDRLRDGSEAPPDGVWLEFDGPLVMCKSGLHFSRHPFDALTYAPGSVLCLVEVGGQIIDGDDRGVCSRRKIIARKDATEGLRYFARMRALSVIHLYPGEPEDCVLDWLVAGDPAARSAAESAAYAADAAGGAAWYAARSAAGSAAWYAAYAADAAWGAAWYAARSAAGSAARSAAYAADAAWGAAESAARQEWADLVAEAFE